MRQVKARILKFGFGDDDDSDDDKPHNVPQPPAIPKPNPVKNQPPVPIISKRSGKK